MSNEYYPGKDCMCNIRYGYESVCVCGADWTDPRVYELEKENKQLKKDIAILKASQDFQNGEIDRLLTENELLKQERDALKEYAQHHNCCDKIHVSDEGIISPIYENKCTCGLETALNKTGESE